MIAVPTRFHIGLTAMRTTSFLRIARGLKKFVLDNPKPFIVGLAHGEHARGAGSRSHGLEEPVRTIQAGANNQALVAPVVAKFRGQSPGTAADQRS